MQIQDSFENVAKSTEPAVVSIMAEQVEKPQPSQPMAFPFGNNDNMFPAPFRQFFFHGAPQPFTAPVVPPTPLRAGGSGFMFKESGGDVYILTNRHVVNGATHIRVTLADNPDNQVTATLVGEDDKTDLAVLKIHPPHPIPDSQLVHLGDSNAVKVGQWAIAIGNPLDVGETFTVGVVSAKGRELNRVEGVKNYSDMIQTDASINHGNSGGPLLDINGNVIGVNTAIASDTGGSVGIGFAIPIDVAKDVAEQLVEHRKIVRGYLGVANTTARQLTPDLARYYGVTDGALVDMVTPGGPGDRAGIKPEDVITGWDGKPIHNFDDLENAVTTTPPDHRATVTIVRNKRPMTVTVTLGTRPSEAALRAAEGGKLAPVPGGGDTGPQTVKPGKLGIEVMPLTPETAQPHGLNPGDGVLIATVDPGSPADDAGLAPGVVILKVNGKPVHTPAEVRAAVDAAGTGRPIVLRVDIAAPGGGDHLQRTVVVGP